MQSRSRVLVAMEGHRRSYRPLDRPGAAGQGGGCKTTIPPRGTQALFLGAVLQGFPVGSGLRQAWVKLQGTIIVVQRVGGLA